MTKRRRQSQERPPPPPERRGPLPLVVGVMLIAGAVAIALIFRGSKEQTVAPATIEAQPVASLPQQPVEVVPQAPAIPRASGWPSDLPPLPLIQFPPPRPREVVQAVYQFAVRHPEVLDYVPCFCGCEHSGHTANTDCFVRSREGGRIAWDDHGMT